MTKIFPIRLLPAEVLMLQQILDSEFCEQENGGELFRLWLHREWNKRNGFGQPEPSDYQSSHRGGSKYRLRRLNEKLQYRITLVAAARNTKLRSRAPNTPSSAEACNTRNAGIPLKTSLFGATPAQKKNFNSYRVQPLKGGGELHIPKSISPSTTRAPGGVYSRTKRPRVTRRAGRPIMRAK